MWGTVNWKDYELLDCTCGERLERWGDRILIRPDPQVIWKTPRIHKKWETADMRYDRSDKGGGSWSGKATEQSWNVKYGKLVFGIKPTSFKHTGLFPEQAVNWDWFKPLIENSEKQVRVLNLFAYTGGATVAAAAAGAAVCHVDAAKGMVARARENIALSGLSEAPVRYIVDDCQKFVERELRRGNRYDAVIMDPPSYGRGPSGEMWHLEDNIYELVKLTAGLMSDRPLFFLLNSYTAGLSASTMGYILNSVLPPKLGGRVVSDEIGLPVSCGGGMLPCGSASRWIANV